MPCFCLVIIIIIIIIVTVLQYLKLEELSEQLRLNQWQVEHRHSLMAIMLHHTVDHSKEQRGGDTNNNSSSQQQQEEDKDDVDLAPPCV